MAEIIVLPVSIAGVGRKGDHIVSDPDHPNPKCRLARFAVLDPRLLPSIREQVARSTAEQKTAAGV
jgi:hypothetical protein